MPITPPHVVQKLLGHASPKMLVLSIRKHGQPTLSSIIGGARRRVGLWYSMI